MRSGVIRGFIFFVFEDFMSTFNGNGAVESAKVWQCGSQGMNVLDNGRQR